MIMNENFHHLVMGELVDFLTGKALDDTHDERYRQKIARHLVEGLGYDKSDIEANKNVTLHTLGRKGDVLVDFLVYRQSRAVMMIKYAPGSLVTRRLSTLALSRLVFDYRIPFVVVTNGNDAELISGENGKVKGQGMDAIPGPDHPLITALPDTFETVSEKMAAQAQKIAFACMIDGSCMIDL